MQRGVRALVCCAQVIAAPTLGVAQSTASGLEGVWSVQAVSSTNPSNKPVGLIQFSGRYYSMMWVEDAARPNFDPRQTATLTADQLRAMWGPLTANAGTFTMSGNTITTTVLVSKNPANMTSGTPAQFTFTLDGDTLVLTRTRNGIGTTDVPLTLRSKRLQ
jgi:hypothetical protein